ATAIRQYLSRATFSTPTSAGLGTVLSAIEERLRQSVDPPQASAGPPRPTVLQTAATEAFSDGTQSIAVAPLTITRKQSLDLGAMGMAELYAEVARVRQHLDKNPVSNATTAALFQELADIEAELHHRDASKPAKQLQEEAHELRGQLAEGTGTSADDVG